MQNDKLLPCPFCGGEARVWVDGLKEDRTYVVKCMSCGSLGSHRSTHSKARKHWNTRKPLERIVERLEERRAVFDCRVCRHFDKGDGSECNEDCTDALIDDLFDIVKGGVDNAG